LKKLFYPLLKHIIILPWTLGSCPSSPTKDNFYFTNGCYHRDSSPNFSEWHSNMKTKSIWVRVETRLQTRIRLASEKKKSKV